MIQDDEDDWLACPRCGGPVEWIKLFDDRDEWFATCTICAWGEDLKILYKPWFSDLTLSV